MRMWRLALIAFIGLALSCGRDYTPKPKGYFKIDLPEKGYRDYTSKWCPFIFEYPVYAEVICDTLFFNEPPENPCWMNIHFPELGGTVHLSYKRINTRQNTLSKLIEDAHKLTFKHTVKADYIDERTIRTPEAWGLVYEVGGDAASNVQFFVTDSVQHFLRGSLYFKSTPNEDSLQPVINFVKEDMYHLIKSFKWKENAPTTLAD